MRLGLIATTLIAANIATTGPARAQSDDGPPGRYVVVTGATVLPSGSIGIKPAAVTVMIDTATGQTWVLSQISASENGWVRMPYSRGFSGTSDRPPPPSN